ncbi:hypothetical protein ACWCXH_38670 [Kitasatospora sp. NPDC001660]
MSVRAATRYQAAASSPARQVLLLLPGAVHRQGAVVEVEGVSGIGQALVELDTGLVQRAAERRVADETAERDPGAGRLVRWGGGRERQTQPLVDRGGYRPLG